MRQPAHLTRRAAAVAAAAAIGGAAAAVGLAAGPAGPARHGPPAHRVPARAGTLAAASYVSSLPPESVTTTSGSTGAGQDFGNLVTQNQSGSQNNPAKYVEFRGHTAGVPYAGYRGYVLPSSIPAESITSMQVKVNYRGPGTGTQTWTWKLYNWAAGAWVTIGDNKNAPDWGKWKVLTFTAPGPFARYVQAGTGAIRVQLVSNNAADDVDLDWENVIVNWSGSLPAPVACTGGPCYAPPPATAWNWQLSTPVDQSAPVTLFDIDLFDNSAAVISQLHQAGKKAYCYLDAGSWENYRPDKNKFPSYVLGNVYQGYPNERWLDVRRLDVLGPIMTARMQLCRHKGFDGVQFDNLDGYGNATGLNLTQSDDLLFQIWLANEAHRLGLGAAFENALENASAIQPYTEWGISEGCSEFAGDCQKGAVFPAAGKLFGDVEYNNPKSKFCPLTQRLGIMAMRKNVNLTAWRDPCT